MSLALAALLALVLLPGLLVVRAPWVVAPALSLAFWVVSPFWPLLSGASRERSLLALLVAFGLFASLRLLPKHQVPPPAGWLPPPEPEPPPRPSLPPSPLASLPSLVVLVAALAALAPAARHSHAPGAGLAFQTTSARLLVWRDAVPRSAEPLLPLAPFGAHAPAIAGLAADVSQLSGSDPTACVLVVFAAALALALLGLFSLAGTRLAPRAAASSALAGAILLCWPKATALWGTGEPLLGLGFALPAAALLLGHASRSSAVAAGLLLAAGLLAQPLLTLLAAAACAAAIVRRRSPVPALRRLGWALATAALLGLPGSWPALRAVSLREAESVLTAVTRGELAGFGAAVVAFVLAATVARRMGPLLERPAVLLPLAAVFTAALVRAEDLRLGHGQLPAESLQAIERLAESTSPLAVVCAPAAVIDWVPALAGRAVGEPGPWIPRVYRDEWASRRRRSCPDALTSFHVLDRNPERSPAYK